MLTYEEFFKSKRPDGRHVNTMAAQMAMLRDHKKVHENIPKYGLSKHDFYYHYSYCVPEDHSFRKDPALRLLKKCFGINN